jgi:UPF0716 protein FxsA
MFRLRWVLVGFLLLPIAELAVFLAVASEIGVLPALGLQLATSLAGAAIIRHAGRAPVSTLRADPGENASPAAFTVAAGILLLVPGFLTDIAGALVLIPIVQRHVLAMLLRALGKPRPDGAPIVELDPGEWHRVDREESGEDRARTTQRHSCPPTPPVLATPPESGRSAFRAKEE